METFDSLANLLEEMDEATLGEVGESSFCYVAGGHDTLAIVMTEPVLYSTEEHAGDDARAAVIDSLSHLHAKIGAMLDALTPKKG